MFDLSSAVVVGLVLTGLVSLVRTIVQGPNPRRITAATCFLVSLATIILVSASDFAHDQVILKQPLDRLNVASQIVVAILAAGIASAVWEGYTAAKNIGENQPSTTVDPNLSPLSQKAKNQ